MTVSKELIQNVKDLKFALNEISVYDLDVYTSIELYYKIANKLNEVIKELARFEGVVSDEVVEQNEKLIYLLGEGLTTEVIKKINQMVLDGTMDTIINHNVFNGLNNKIDNFKQEVNEQFITIMNSVTTVLGVKNDGTEDISLKLLDYAQDKEFLYLYFPQGRYKWDNNVLLKNKKIKFVGDNAIIEHYNNRGHAIRIGDVDSHVVEDFYFSGIEVINKRPKSVSDIGGITSLIVDDAQNVTIKDLSLIHI